jgi:hypothetical protein
MTQFILVYTHPTEGEQRFKLVPGRSYRIGSRPDNDIVIDQKDVSRRHAVLRVQDGSFHITDLDSKNGTFINGAKTVSETFNCGDMVHLSSARLVIVEIGTGSYPTVPDVIANDSDDFSSPGRDETQKFRSEASMEDVVSLLETTATAVGHGALAEPLGWAVDHLGFDGAVILYRDDNDSVAMVSSAGDLGQLTRKSGVLAKLVVDHRLTSAAGTKVRQVSEMGESLLVATVGAEHVLVVRYSGRPPAIGDLRSVIAAVKAVLASGNLLGKGGAGRAGRIGSPGSGTNPPEDRLVGLSEPIHRCRQAVSRAAQRSGPVVITGERGSGCSLVARCIHDLSSRAAAPFVVVDLKGASIDAIENRLLIAGEAIAGADEAEGGTLVLDHLPDFSPDFLKTVFGVVADRSSEVPRLMLIRNLDDPGETESVGEDSDGDHVVVPALRSRNADVLALVSAWSRDGDGGSGRAHEVSFTNAALELLLTYGWPGNVAELWEEVRKAVAAAADGLVDVEHLSDEVRLQQGNDRVPQLDLEDLVDGELAQARNAFESWMIRRALAATDGSQTKAAGRLGLSRAGLFKKIRKLGL